MYAPSGMVFGASHSRTIWGPSRPRRMRTFCAMRGLAGSRVMVPDGKGGIGDGIRPSPSHRKDGGPPEPSPGGTREICGAAPGKRPSLRAGRPTPGLRPRPSGRGPGVSPSRGSSASPRGRVGPTPGSSRIWSTPPGSRIEALLLGPRPADDGDVHLALGHDLVREHRHVPDLGA